MAQVRSSDGTHIAYETRGDGPPLILVDGALCSRTMGPSSKLAARLDHAFTVYTYDRRGRGESGDAPRYAVEREVEDLQALIEAAGGSASLYGTSSGAALALETAARGHGVEKLALYEAPFIVDDSREPLPDNYLETLEDHLAAGRRSAAVEQFMRFVGMPGLMLGVFKRTPVWRKLEAVAPTLPNDTRIVQDHQRGKPLPAGRWDTATMPALVIAGGKSPAWMQNSARALADILPSAELRTLPKQNHMVKPKVLAPVLVDFLRGPDRGAESRGPIAEATAAARA